jgi:predicted molibdopterin-dependent oxidoreductase YjgC
MLPEEVSGALDAYRLNLSDIADAQAVVVLGDVPLTESAPIVDLWVRKARRNGAVVVDSTADVGDAERIVLIWSGPGGRGGFTVAQEAEKLGLAGKPGCGAFYVPATPNARGIADAWAAASEGEGPDSETIGLLLVSGDEAANDPNVRALAERADAVIVVSMFHGLAAGWADLVLPATSYLERDGTYVNLEGRLQRLRRSVAPPCPDELEWISQLAARLGVDVAPYPASVFAEVSATCYGGLSFAEVGERAALRGYDGASPHVDPPAAPVPTTTGDGLRLVCYKPLFSGPAVERVSELQFQRPQAEAEISAADAKQRGIANGEPLTLTAAGTTVTLRARVNKKLRSGIVRVAHEHSGGLQGFVDIAPAGAEVTA